eukprot:9476482-Pyramimonas_sp.AAC.1
MPCGHEQGASSNAAPDPGTLTRRALRVSRGPKPQILKSLGGAGGGPRGPCLARLVARSVGASDCSETSPEGAQNAPAPKKSKRDPMRRTTVPTCPRRCQDGPRGPPNCTGSPPGRASRTPK